MCTKIVENLPVIKIKTMQDRAFGQIGIGEVFIANDDVLIKMDTHIPAGRISHSNALSLLTGDEYFYYDRIDVLRCSVAISWDGR